MKKYKKILRGLGSAIVTLIAIAALAILGNYLHGKQNLSENIVSEEKNVETILYHGKEYVYRENVVNILCMGIDKEEQMAIRNDVGNSVGQADAIFLVSLDLDKDEVRVLAIPRDTMVTLQMYTVYGR